MAFNDERRKLATVAKQRLGEPALYQPKAGGEIATTVIAHRTQRDADGLSQPGFTITVFNVGDDEDVGAPKYGDAIVLTDTSETFKVEHTGHIRDEFKTRLAVTDVTGMPDDD